jgi:hypothetical protein
VPWAELKKYPPTQDAQAEFPLNLYAEFDDLRSELESMRDELSLLKYKQNAEGRDLCPYYYKFRFRNHFHSFGYGAYCTFWTIEGWYDDE